MSLSPSPSHCPPSSLHLVALTGVACGSSPSPLSQVAPGASPLQGLSRCSPHRPVPPSRHRGGRGRRGRRRLVLWPAAVSFATVPAAVAAAAALCGHSDCSKLPRVGALPRHTAAGGGDHRGRGGGVGRGARGADAGTRGRGVVHRPANGGGPKDGFYVASGGLISLLVALAIWNPPLLGELPRGFSTALVAAAAPTAAAVAVPFFARGGEGGSWRPCGSRSQERTRRRRMRGGVDGETH